MNTSSEFKTDWPQSPGATILSIAEGCGKSLHVLTKELGSELLEVVRETKPISQTFAQRLEEGLGGSRNFWLRRDASFQAARLEADLETETEWVKSLPYSDIAKLGWLPKTKKSEERISHLYDFFGCDNLREWHATYDSTLDRVAFRTTYAFENNVGATLAWLRMGDIHADAIETGDFDPEMLARKVELLKRECRRSSQDVFLPSIKKILAEVGVCLVIVRAPKGCRASGATRINSQGTAVLQLSFRYLTDDHFWFTLFHEIGHLILHRGDAVFLEGAFVENDPIEEEANAFAAQALISEEHREGLKEMSVSSKTLIRKAFELGISPGILVGQMQHMGLIPVANMNFLKRRFRWC